MVESMDSLDFSSEMPNAEKNAIPLDCWHDFSLSDIWISSHLLPNRSRPSNMRVPQGIYHTLEKKDSSKYAKSFSVYSFSDIENEQGEIFISDSDDDIFGFDSASFEKIKVSDNTLPAVANHVRPHSSACSNELRNSTEINILNKKPERENRHLNSKENLIVNGRTSPSLSDICQEEKVRAITSSDENLINKKKNLQNDGGVCSKSLSMSVNSRPQKHFAAVKENHEVEMGGFEDRFMQASGRINKNTDSFNSLKDISDDTSEINMKDFLFDFKKKDDSILLSSYDKKGKKIKKNKKDKVKKKPLKYLPLDNLLETNTEVSQDYYCDKYFQSILKDKQKDNCCSNISVGNNVEFPDLAFKDYTFIHSDKAVKENDIKSTFINLRYDFNRPKELNENENIVDVEEIKPHITDTMNGKIVIENIPPDVTRDGISEILCGYGEMKKFSLVPVGNFLTAYVEIDMICDIDWIIECLNESEPFGASTEKLRCYKQ